MMKIGAHLSIADSLTNALEEGKRLEINALQIFSGPPRGWQFPQRSNAEIEKFKLLSRKYKISPIFIHAKYLVNLASENQETRDKSINSLVEDLNLAEKINAAGVIFHPHPQNISLLIQSIGKLLARTPKSVFLILENSAQTTIEEMGEIIKKTKDKRVRFCFDTAHAFEAGDNIADEKELEKTIEKIKEKIGFSRWVAIHANDSKTKLSSRHDQHADIGEGEIGEKAFRTLSRHPIAGKLPFILETPAGKKEGSMGWEKNIKALKKFF